MSFGPSRLSRLTTAVTIQKMRPQFILFGDSITQQSFYPNGWGAALTDDYSRKADVVLRGYSGYNTRWALFMLHHIFPLNGVTRPVATTVFFGANDAAVPERTSGRQHVPIQEYGENLRKIVHHLKECSPSMLVVLITPPPIDEEGRLEYARSIYTEVMELPERTNEVAGLYAKKCLEVAKDLGLPSIDLWSKMQESAGWQKKYFSDGLHLTAQGNAVVHKEITKVFNEAGFCASEMPFDFPPHPEIDTKNPEKANALQYNSSIFSIYLTHILWFCFSYFCTWCKFWFTFRFQKPSGSLIHGNCSNFHISESCLFKSISMLSIFKPQGVIFKHYF